ncbi:MAG TPA: multicopper oxidase domain-containing protein [Pyrinomonadaceae bacterium]|jgi:FtsP/CotA-like multicopper oxidase with cupredoxin domain|nr:multicopper oxidase domain-containing protein [Pyrinomonadaceae bacterium]
MKIGKDSKVKTRWRNRAVKMFIIAAGIMVACILSAIFVNTPPAAAQLGSPPFVNPPELVSSKGKLRAVMEIISRNFTVPGQKAEQYRQFRGHYPNQPLIPGTAVGPGPTLRARLGDQMQLAFLNKVDGDEFPYTYVTGRDKPPFSDLGCDSAGLLDPVTGKFPYPANDIYPNCFHGSNTANIHFHGTHTSPDGLGDNVLVQVLPEMRQPDWTTVFNKIYSTGKIPQNWSDLPPAFRTAQTALVKKRDATDMANAMKNNLRPPESMSKANAEQIAAGEWPQYFIGAFPNFFDIPDYSSGNYKAGQAPGTQWYHAHKHGSTSLHMRNGLSGALVIESSQEGGYDHFIRKSLGWGATYGDHEKILVIQQYDSTSNLERSPKVPGGAAPNLVNGLLTPTITMKPGEIQLWRLVNATEGNGGGVITAGTTAGGVFGAPTFKFVQTAQDGVQFSLANYLSQPYLNPDASNPASAAGLVLAGGNRADLLVQAPLEAGTTTFVSVGGATLFFVKVEGTPVTSMSFPTTWAEMPKFLLDLPKPGPKDIPNPNSPVQFQWEAGRVGPGRSKVPPPAGPHFMINGKQFGDSGPIVDQCMPLDGLQDWVLENYTSVIAHPFHIHINPFQILQIQTPTAQGVYSTYTPANNYIWQDVIAIPPAIISKDGTQITPGRVVIRQTYLDFTGTYVLHCHILAHEDRGMMQLVRVVPLANYPQGCQAAPPQHH